MTRLAASELQDYVFKMTGAMLPITNAPGPGAVHVFVGRSAGTDRLKTTDEGLKYGAFRMVAGEDHLVLLGHDSDFTPKQPYHPGGPLKYDSPAMIEWDKVTGEKWGFPLGNLFKQQSPPLRIIEEARRGAMTSTVARFWEKDQRGSLNAVYEFLRLQGIRWYMPGPLGEIVPRKATIEVPRIDRTVRPDFAMRHPILYYRLYSFEGATRDEILWQLRMGIDQANDLMGDHEMSLGHGITYVHSRDEVKKAHPEYYGVFGGKRDTEQFGGGRPCLSSKGLFDDNVKYVRAMFDLYDAPVVSVMPQDGYGSTCECPLCEGKGTPERGWEGQISDYVWDYVNRVAQEVYKTHPNKKVSCLAYGSYTLPPGKIDVLSPNIVVGIAQGRVSYREPDRRYDALRKAWLAKLPEGSRQLWIWEYYLYGTDRSSWRHMPVFFPHSIARDLRSLKGIGLGEFIEVYRQRLPGIDDLAVTHLNLYVTTRLWWNADQDVDALLNEYYTLFYGPAADGMRDFINYAEANYLDMGKDAAKIGKALELMAKAQAEAPAGSVFARRIALIADYIKPMRELKSKLGKGRENVPEAVAAERADARIKLDGILDEGAWRDLAVHELGRLPNGGAPAFGTSFRMLWSGDSLYLGVECRDESGKQLNFKPGKRDDSGVWNGDCVELLLETQTHSYYQLAMNPAATFVDMDNGERRNTLWTSGAEVATHIGTNGWTIEMRLPVAAANQEQLDPLNGVAGSKPSQAYPWYFNLCRQRMRDNERTLSTFSPTGTDHFHELLKFGKLYVK